MKLKTLLLSLLLAGVSVSAFAQNSSEANMRYSSPKFGDNIYISVGAGVQGYMNISNFDYGFGKSFTPLLNLSVGKNFTPKWGVRLQASALQSKLHSDINRENNGGNFELFEHKYIGLGADFMVNLTNLWRSYNPDNKFDLLAFVGPGLYLGKFNQEDLTANINASAGLGAKYNISNSFAIDLEARASMTPTMYPHQSRSYQDGVLGVSAGLSYTFGGRKFEPTNGKNMVSKAKYADLATKASALENENANLKNRKPQVVEKVVNKDVLIYGKTPASAITFPFNVSRVPQNQTIAVYNWAKFLKNNPSFKISIIGYADKVGTKSANDKISVKRANAVKEMLVKTYGISADRIYTDGRGNAEIYDQNDWNRCVLINIVTE